MNYAYSEEQKMLKSTISSLLSHKMPFERFRDIAEKKGGFSLEDWKMVAEGGWLELLRDSQSSERSSVSDLMYICEEFGSNLFPGPYTLVASFIIPLISQLSLSQRQQTQLDQVGAGEALITAALPRFEYRSEGLQCHWNDLHVSADEADRIQLKGKLTGVPFAQHANFLLVPIENPTGGIVTVLLDLNSRKLNITDEKSLDLSRPQGSIEFDEIWIDKNEILGSWEDNQCSHWYKQLTTYALCLNGEMLGGINKILDKTINYVRERKQFGVPVGSFQSVKHIISDMKVCLENARSYNSYVAWEYENNPELNPLKVAASRSYTTKKFKEICEKAIQMHGGMGFTWEEGIHFWYKASINHLYHLAHPTVLNKFILQSLREK